MGFIKIVLAVVLTVVSSSAIWAQDACRSGQFCSWCRVNGGNCAVGGAPPDCVCNCFRKGFVEPFTRTSCDFTPRRSFQEKMKAPAPGAEK